MLTSGLQNGRVSYQLSGMSTPSLPQHSTLMSYLTKCHEHDRSLMRLVCADDDTQDPDLGFLSANGRSTPNASMYCAPARKQPTQFTPSGNTYPLPEEHGHTQPRQGSRYTSLFTRKPQTWHVSSVTDCPDLPACAHPARGARRAHFPARTGRERACIFIGRGLQRGR